MRLSVPFAAILPILAAGLSGCFAVEYLPEESGILLITQSTPVAQGVEDTLYDFIPGEPIVGVTFSIVNAPSWAQFDPATGRLYGFPSFGEFEDISIVATRGEQSQTIGPFKITVNGDPFTAETWGLENTGQKSYSKSPGVAGADGKVRAANRLGALGDAIRVVVSDTGMQIAHEDLADNVVAGASRNYETHAFAPFEDDPGIDDEEEDGFFYGDHGTSVGGVIAAVGWNGKGGRGVAPKADLVAFNFLRNQTDATEQDQITYPSGSVFNQSWGIDSEEYVIIPPLYLDHMRDTLLTYRQGKGATLVRSAGNSFVYNFPVGSTRRLPLNANSDGYNTIPYQIVVAAINADGKHSGYSSPGSCIWISAPAGWDGRNLPATVTTDVMGCDAGASRTESPQNTFQQGQQGNSECNYTSSFNGTSSAAPFVSGVAALLLEANPNLSWRDVKYILAKTATRVDPNRADFYLGGDVPNHVNMPKWSQNAAGNWYHMWYGFGAVNAEAAVRMAQTYGIDLGTYEETVDGDGYWRYDTGPSDMNLSIPDFNATGVETTLTVIDPLTIEAVQISVMITHPFIGDIGLELISPSGTRSVVMQTNNALYAENFGLLDYLTDPTAPIQIIGSVMLSNAFLDEMAAGVWKLNLIDGKFGNSGKLNRWAINIAGHR